MDASAYSDNGQRKFIRDSTNGYIFQTYTDDGHAWLEYSTDNGSSWSLLNSGEPLDYNSVNGTGPGSKCPSLDYDPSTGDVVVVFEVPSGSYYNINYAAFGPPASSYGLLSGGPIYEESSDSYSVNANPTIAFYYGSFWVLTFERKITSGSHEAGINFLFGSYDGLMHIDGYETAPTTVSNVLPGTNASSTDATVYGYKGQTTLMEAYIAWEQVTGSSSSEIQWSEVQFYNPSAGTLSVYGSPTNPVTISSGSIPENYNPSIVQYLSSGSFYARVSWIGDQLPGQRPQLYINGYWASISSPSNYTEFENGDLASISSNLIDNSSSYYLAWAGQPSPGYWQDQVSSGGSGPGTDINTSGEYVQLCNGAATSDMYVSAYYPFSTPYYFSRSNPLSTYLGESMPVKGPVNTVASVTSSEVTNSTSTSGSVMGRGVYLNDGALNFAYYFTGLTVDGNTVPFVKAPDSLDYYDMPNVNKVFVTAPFQLSQNPSVIFSDESGFADSLAAVEVLGDTGYVRYCVQLINPTDDNVLGTIENTTLNRSGVHSYDVHS